MKMYGKLGRLLIVAGLLVSGLNAHAAQQFWVSLGSYSKLSGAEEMRSRALGTFSQLSVVPSESAIGFVYRVVDGPVDNRATAEARLEKARMAGFVEAWLLIKDESYVMPEGPTEAELAASTSGAPAPTIEDDRYSSDYGLQDSASSAVLGGYSSEYAGESATTSSGGDDDYVNLPLGKQELVEKAPVGYGLHQLRRAGDAANAGTAVESRLRELDKLSEPEDD